MVELNPKVGDWCLINGTNPVKVTKLCKLYFQTSNGDKWKYSGSPYGAKTRLKHSTLSTIVLCTEDEAKAEVARVKEIFRVQDLRLEIEDFFRTYRNASRLSVPELEIIHSIIQRYKQ